MTSMFTGKEADPVWAAAEITRRRTVVHEISHSDAGLSDHSGSQSPLGSCRSTGLAVVLSRLGTLALYLAAFTPSSVTLPCLLSLGLLPADSQSQRFERPNDHPQPDNDDAEKFCQRWV